MQRLRTVFASLAISALGCAALPVYTDFDGAEDFSKLSTFAWLTTVQQPTGDVRIDNPLLDARVRTATDEQLTAQGYLKVPEDRADFLVGYHLSLKTKLDVYMINSHYGYGRRGYYELPETTVDEYEQGTLLLDVVSARSRKLVWRGWTSKRVGTLGTPEERDARVREVVNAILAEFPPTPAEN